MISYRLFKTLLIFLLCLLQISPQSFILAADDPPPGDIEVISAEPPTVEQSSGSNLIPNELVGGGFPSGGAQFLNPGKPNRFIIDPKTRKIYTDYPSSVDTIHIDIATSHGVITEDNVGRGYVRGFFRYISGEWVMEIDPREALTVEQDISNWTSRSFLEEYFSRLTQEPNARFLHGLRIRILTANEMPTSRDFYFHAQKGLVERGPTPPPGGGGTAPAEEEPPANEIEDYLKELEAEKKDPPKEELEEPQKSDLELKEPETGDPDSKLYETAKKGRKKTVEEKTPDFKDVDHAEVLPADEEAGPAIENVGESSNQPAQSQVDESLKPASSGTSPKESLTQRTKARIIKMKVEATKAFRRVIRKQSIKVRRVIFRGRKFAFEKFQEYKRSITGLKNAPIHHIGLIILALWDIGYAYYDKGFWEGSSKLLSFVGFWILFHEVFSGIGAVFGEVVAASLGEVLALATWFVIIGRYAEEKLIWSSIDDLYLQEFYTGERGFKNPMGGQTSLNVGFLGPFQMSNSPVKGETRETFYLKFTSLDALRSAVARHIRNLIGDDVIGPVLPPHAKSSALWTKIVDQAERDWKAGWGKEVKKMKEAWEKEKKEELALEEQELAATEEGGEKSQPEVEILGYKLDPEKPKAGDTITFHCQYAVFGLPGDKVAAKESLTVSGDDKNQPALQEKTSEFDVGEVVKILSSDFSFSAGEEESGSAEWKVELNPGNSASLPLEWKTAPESAAVSVSVSDSETGDPLSGAQAVLDDKVTQMTGGDGATSFGEVTAGSHFVRVSAAYYESKTGMVEIKGKESKSLAFKLKTSAVNVSVEGRVVRSSDRAGVTGALVETIPKGKATQLTNDAGEYSIPVSGIKPKDTILVEAKYTDASGKTFSGGSAAVYPGKTDAVLVSDITLEIKQKCEISGTVFDSDDAPFEGVHVQTDKGASTTSSGDGSFSLTIEDASIGASCALTASYGGKDGKVYASSPVSVKFEGAPVTGVQLKVPFQLVYKDVSVSGYVFDMDQLGVASASVSVNGISVTTDSDGKYQVKIDKIRLEDQVRASSQTAGPDGKQVGAQVQTVFKGNPIADLNMTIPIARIFKEVQVWGVVFNTTGAEINAANVHSDHGGNSTTNVSGQFSLIASDLRKGDVVNVIAEQVIEDAGERTTYAGSTQATFQGTEITNLRIVLADKPARVDPILKPEDSVEISISSFSGSKTILEAGESLTLTLVYFIAGIPQGKNLALTGMVESGAGEKAMLSGDVSNGPWTKTENLSISKDAQAGRYQATVELKVGNKSASGSFSFEIKSKEVAGEAIQLSIVNLTPSPEKVSPGQGFDVTLVYGVSGLPDGEKINISGSISAGGFGQDSVSGEVTNGQWTKSSHFMVPESASDGSYHIQAQVQAGSKSAQSSATLTVVKEELPETTEPPESTEPPATTAPPAATDGVPGESFCAVCRITMPEAMTPPPKKAEKEEEDAYKQRLKVFVDGLTLQNVRMKTSDNSIAICISGSALDSFSKEDFASGEKFALPFKALMKSEQGSQTLDGGILLTVEGVYPSAAQALAVASKSGQGSGKAIEIKDSSGSFDLSDEKGSASGNLARGWSPENQQKALDLYKYIVLMFNCFVASVVYGDPQAPQVKVLRNFRDEVLISSKVGRQAVGYYYQYGPSLAYWVLRHPKIIPAIRTFMDFLVLWVDARNDGNFAVQHLPNMRCKFKALALHKKGIAAVYNHSGLYQEIVLSVLASRLALTRNPDLTTSHKSDKRRKTHTTR